MGNIQQYWKVQGVPLIYHTLYFANSFFCYLTDFINNLTKYIFYISPFWHIYCMYRNSARSNVKWRSPQLLKHMTFTWSPLEIIELYGNSDFSRMLLPNALKFCRKNLFIELYLAPKFYQNRSHTKKVISKCNDCIATTKRFIWSERTSALFSKKLSLRGSVSLL
jgi:hypothetical protein